METKLHSGANPTYGSRMVARQDAQAHNRSAHKFMPMVSVPKQPNKYCPHYGAKEAAKYALRAATSKTVRDIASTADEELALTEVAMIGQTVTWTSSNLTKIGEIVAVVPAGERPSAGLKPKVDVSGSPRDHISYVVRANGKHYWPRVSLLNLGGL